jgi:molybdopterin/thiamine biosynthesis adenylyltransferase
MSEVAKFLKKRLSQDKTLTPIFFNLSKKQDKNRFITLIKNGEIRFINDDFKEQLKELYQIKNPQKVFNPDFKLDFLKYLKNLKKKSPLYEQGVWVYFPWLLSAVHILNEDDFYLVRTARNKNLINAHEQDKFYNSTIGIAGLSVGNSVALAIVLQGGAKKLKLADFDKLALSNINRIRAGIDFLGLNKAEMTARQIYLLNPYAQITLYKEGLTKDNIEDFFKGLDIVIDEIDNMALKILIRQHAQKNKIPVLMATDNGDNGMVEIERYDNEENLTYFHGNIKAKYDEILKMNKIEIGKLITKYVGAQNVAPRMQESLLEIGKSIVSWPQLGGAALLNGCAIAYCVRKILNNQPLINRRAYISLDEILDPQFNSKKAILARKIATEKFKKAFGI